MKKLTPATVEVIIAVLLVLAGVSFWVISMRPAQAPNEQVCTMEAKLCPDGSAVGRSGPNCEFAECPTGGAGTTGSDTTYDSGVRGTVMIGPTCPVQRVPADPACADKPYATAILVYPKGALAPYVIGNSATTGAFTFMLPAGTYTIGAGSGSALPRCTPVEVTVTADAYAVANITCDSGIR